MNKDELFNAPEFDLHSRFKPELLKSECEAFSIALGRDPDCQSVTELYQFRGAERNFRDIDAARPNDDPLAYMRAKRKVNSVKGDLENIKLP